MLFSTWPTQIECTFRIIWIFCNLHDENICSIVMSIAQIFPSKWIHFLYSHIYFMSQKLLLPWNEIICRGCKAFFRNSKYKSIYNKCLSLNWSERESGSTLGMRALICSDIVLPASNSLSCYLIYSLTCWTSMKNVQNQFPSIPEDTVNKIIRCKP